MKKAKQFVSALSVISNDIKTKVQSCGGGTTSVTVNYNENEETFWFDNWKEYDFVTELAYVKNYMLEK